MREKYAIKAIVWYPYYTCMFKAGGKGMAGIAMAILSFVKPDILPDSQSHCQGTCNTHACSDLVEPRSLISTGKAWATSLLGIWLFMGLVASRNSALPKTKDLHAHLCACVKICMAALVHDRWLGP